MHGASRTARQPFIGGPCAPTVRSGFPILALVEWILDVVGSLPPPLVVFLLAMFPIAELRASIPIGLFAYQMPLAEVLVLSIAGNFLPVPFILWFLRPLERLLRRVSWMDRFLTWLFARTRNKSIEHIEQYEEAALTVFVAVPLPGTGAWTGALVAYLFDLPFRKSLFFIFLGIIGAAAIVTLLVEAGVTLFF